MVVLLTGHHGRIQLRLADGQVGISGSGGG